MDTDEPQVQQNDVPMVRNMQTETQPCANRDSESKLKHATISTVPGQHQQFLKVHGGGRTDDAACDKHVACWTSRSVLGIAP